MSSLKGAFFLILAALLLLWGPLKVSATLITFEAQDIGTEIQDQFQPDIIFNNSLGFDSNYRPYPNGDAPGSVQESGYLSLQSMRAYQSSQYYSMYIFFSTPISYLEAYIYEVGSGNSPPSGENPVIEDPEQDLDGPVDNPDLPVDEVVVPNTVYFQYFSETGEQSVENSFSNINNWEHWIYNDVNYEIAAVSFYSSNPFYIDNLSTEPQPTSAPVPEPATLILLITGALGLTILRKKFC